MTVGGARGERLSLRVPAALKARVRAVVADLQARGLRTSESELVELFVSEGVELDVDAVAARLVEWRVGGQR
jgi:hypothetical protein